VPRKYHVEPRLIVPKIPLFLIIFILLLSTIVFSGCDNLDLVDQIKDAITGAASDQNTSENNSKDGKKPVQVSKEPVFYKKKNFYKDKSFITLSDETTPEGPRLTAHLPEKTKKETVVITGSTEPGCSVFVNGKKVITSGNGNFSVHIQLTPGKNNIEVAAENKQNQSTVLHLETTFDAPVPRLTVNLPSQSDKEVINLTGITGVGCRVEVNNNTVHVSYDGSFTASARLVPGTNSISITSTNKFGKSTTVQKMVNFQPPNPRLVVALPETSKKEKVTVSGFTEPGCVVYINSARAQVNPDGSFSHTITLNEGANLINVISVNKFGKSSAAQKTVTYANW